MNWFKRKPPIIPGPPKVCVELVEYLDNENGNKFWDVRIHRDGRMYSATDVFLSRDEAVAAYARQLAIERGETKIGLSRYTIHQTEIT